MQENVKLPISARTGPDEVPQDGTSRNDSDRRPAAESLRLGAGII
jgi:hypothetical protein